MENTLPFLLVILITLVAASCGRSVTFTKIDHPTIVLTSSPSSILIQADASSLPSSAALTLGFEERSGQDAYMTKLLYKIYGAKDEQLLLDGSRDEKSIVIGGDPTGLLVRGNSQAAAQITFVVDSLAVGSLAHLLDLSDGVGEGCGKGTIFFKAQGYDNDGLGFVSAPFYVQLTIRYPPCN